MEKPETAAQRDQREAEILAGEIPVELSDGRTIAVREIRWGESLRLGAKLRTIIEEVAKKASIGQLDPIGIWEIPEDYPVEFMGVMSQVTGLPADELQGLSEDDGQLLTAAFWAQNTPFFARRVGRIVRLARDVDPSQTPETSTQPPRENSSPPSSGTDTPPTA